MASPKRTLIVNYLPQALTDRSFLDLFSKVGEVESCKIVRDMQNGYSYGFGFVTFVNAEDGQKAIELLNGSELGNKRIKVSIARPSGETIKNTNLFVTNLPRNFTENDLDNLFGKFGNIVQKKLLLDKLTGQQRGTAFVRFEKREEAQDAINNLNGYLLDGATESLVVKVAEDHGKHRIAYYAGLQVGMRRQNAPLVHPYNLMSHFDGEDFLNPIHSMRSNNCPNNNYGEDFLDPIHSMRSNNCPNNNYCIHIVNPIHSMRRNIRPYEYYNGRFVKLNHPTTKTIMPKRNYNGGFVNPNHPSTRTNMPDRNYNGGFVNPYHPTLRTIMPDRNYNGGFVNPNHPTTSTNMPDRNWHGII